MSARKTPHKPGPPHPSWSCQLCSLLCLPLPSRVFGVSYPVCPSNPMSLVPLTLFAPPLSCFWSSLPCLPLPSHVFGAPYCLPLPSHVFGVPYPVCPSPPMFLVFLTLFVSPIPCLWCSSLCLPLPSHVFGVPHPVCPSHPMSFVHPLLCLPTLLYLHVFQPTHLHCMVSSDLSRILRHLIIQII